MEQLADGGRIVVPLRMRGLTRTVAFDLDGGCPGLPVVWLRADAGRR
ncbi:hypothetical protein [Frankia sp. QA3]